MNKQFILVRFTEFHLWNNLWVKYRVKVEASHDWWIHLKGSSSSMCLYLFQAA